MALWVNSALSHVREPVATLTEAVSEPARNRYGNGPISTATRTAPQVCIAEPSAHFAWLDHQQFVATTMLGRPRIPSVLRSSA